MQAKVLHSFHQIIHHQLGCHWLEYPEEHLRALSPSC
uniref:Uncharacterized protein n=1 Tax=Arundo donax TaxID=35708 RepID=A0A0A8YQ26_ARUDO